MEKVKDKVSRYLYSSFYRVGLVFFFLIFYTNCKAQNMQAMTMKETENALLSGLYSSKTALVTTEKNGFDSTNFLPSGYPVNKQHYKEEIEKRTRTSRSFNDGQGGVIIQYGSKNINYLDKENKFQPLSAKLTTSPHPSPQERESEQASLTYSPLSCGEGIKGRGVWAALQQQFPTYLYEDGSTALSADEKDKIIFNKNCKIDGKEINLSDFTVGEDGMFINDAIEGIDKKIIFFENTIETDYIIRKPVSSLNHDLIISEEINLPEGYSITPLPDPLHRRGSPNTDLSPITPSLEERGGQTASGCLSQLVHEAEVFVIYSPEGIEKARFKVPVFYDGNKMMVFGKYNLIQEASNLTPSRSPQGEGSVKYILQIIVPEKWLNDVNRVYPLTIDPVVTGPVSNYPATFMNSCQYPNFEKDSILITIPAEITITKFIVEDSYFADLFAIPTPTLLDGYLYLSTVCNPIVLSCSDTAASSLPGTCYIVPNTDFKSYLACCFSPSCSDQTFYLVHGFARSNLGPGCNQTYIYYSPLGTWPFSAFVVGKTVETMQSEWSVSPTTVCSDSCTIFLDVTTRYGVPPYTVTHPWATGPTQYGAASGSCNSIGTETIALTIPGCPTTCGTNSTLSVPPPVIVDVCGVAVAGLSPKSITVKPVPVAIAPPVSVCSGTQLSIPVSSCVAGSSFQWTGDNGSSGTGNITDNVINTGPTLTSINYSVIPTANGCVGQSISVSAEIDTLPVIEAGLNDTIEPGVSIQLNASGGLIYSWTPSAGLSCTDCSNPSAAPALTTTYYVSGTNEYGCSSYDTINIFVKQGDEVLYIPNSFTPNANYLNDLFCVYGTSIKIIDMQIYDRWGEMIFRSNDIQFGWDGKFHGTDVEGGVYVYKVYCEWKSGATAFRNGIITVVR